MSSRGPKDGSWSEYSRNYLNLGNAPGGEIDPHVFVDQNGKSYLVWKTDDNSVGAKVTRIWAQACRLGKSGLTLKGNKRELMDSTGLWWVDSWTPGGSLVEGPEIVRRGKYYYLFFASGRFCQDSYSEGVARATNIWGPYRKMGVPLLNTAMVGFTSSGAKLSGPGHASFVQDKRGEWYAVWHASPRGTCDRHAYVDRLAWSSDGWPYIEFTSSNLESDEILFS